MKITSARVELGAEPLQTRDDIAKQAQFAAADVANNGAHAVRPAAHQAEEVAERQQIVPA